MSDTPTPAALLSDERLDEIRALQGEWTSYAASKPWRAAGNTPQLATTYAGELLAHLDAREKEFAAREHQYTEALKGLLWRPDTLSQLEPDDQVKMQMRNNDVCRAATSLGIDLTT